MTSILSRFLAVLLLLSTTIAIAQPRMSKQQCDKMLTTLLTGLNSQDPEILARMTPKINELHKEMEGLDYAGIVPWTERRSTKIKRKLALLQIKFWAKTLPKYDKTQVLGPATVNIDEIRFAQLNAANITGEYTVVGNAQAIKAGKLDISKFPKLRVWRDVDGKIWTLDHRRLVAMRLAGNIEDVEVEFVKSSLVNLHGFKFSTETDGLTIVLKFSDAEDKNKDLVAVIINDQKRLKKEAIKSLNAAPFSSQDLKLPNRTPPADSPTP